MDLETKKRLALLEREARDILENAVIKTPNVVFSSSGGIDSEVIFYIIKKFNINVKAIFFNKAVENPHNVKRLKVQKKHFEIVHEVKTESYNSIVSRLGFPIKNKDFSNMCYRARSTEISYKNLNDKYRLVTGTSLKRDSFKEDIIKNKKINIYSIPLNMWYLALNYPIQSKCCDIFKKRPAKKIKAPMIVGVMKESPARKRMIKDTFKGKYFPLQSWSKSDVLNYIKLHNVPHSEAYDDKEINVNGIQCTIKGNTNTGCRECHYSQNTGHYIIVNGEVKKIAKFDKLKLEKPKAYRAMMSRVHKETGITFEETIQVYEDSLNDVYLDESIKLRNAYIKDIIRLMQENKAGIDFHPKALETIQNLLIEEN